VATSIAVSSWALHRTIGVSYQDSPAAGTRPADRHGDKPIELLELPALLAAHGYTAMQLCHFHLPSREPAYLAELKQALSASQISLHAVLIDDGDPSDPVNAARDMAWISGWTDTAEELGAAHVRIIAGKQETSPEGIQRAAANLKTLASGRSLRVETENWFPLLASPAAVMEFLDRCEGTVGLCADWGNWSRPRKYDDLPLILPRAETCHAKLEFTAADQLDEEDAAACIGMTRSSGFAGTYVLVNGGMGDSEWAALDIQREAILA
jgi:hypothetical protein